MTQKHNCSVLWGGDEMLTTTYPQQPARNSTGVPSKIVLPYLLRQSYDLTLFLYVMACEMAAIMYSMTEQKGQGVITKVWRYNGLLQVYVSYTLFTLCGLRPRAQQFPGAISFESFHIFIFTQLQVFDDPTDVRPFMRRLRGIPAPDWEHAVNPRDSITWALNLMRECAERFQYVLVPKTVRTRAPTRNYWVPMPGEVTRYLEAAHRKEVTCNDLWCSIYVL